MYVMIVFKCNTIFLKHIFFSLSLKKKTTIQQHY